MKIFIPFARKDIGGTSIFATKFKEGMEKLGHEVFFEYREDYDVLFLIVQAPFRYLLDAKRRGKKIIQRLDGTYYWSVASWKFPLYNLKATFIRHLFTDFTVYQSRYSKYCAEKFLGRKNVDPSAVIYNGVNTHHFSPNGETFSLRSRPEQKVFFTASDFRRRDQIIPILEALVHYRETYGDNFVFLVAGTFSREASTIPEEWAHFKNVSFLGKIANSDLPKYERGADVFLITHLNPPCPNNVLEALACGLPICGVADGAMSELVDSGETGFLIQTEGDAFWQPRKIDPQVFSDALHKTLSSPEYRDKSRMRALDRFSIDHMIAEYQSIITKTLSL